MAGGPLYGIVVPGSAAALALLAPPASAPEGRIDVRDLGAVLGIYAGVVGLFSLAFRYFTQERTAGLFVSFAAGLLLGVAGPVVYTVWMRTRPLADLGLSRTEWGRAVALGLVLAGVQFALTLYGYPLPAPVDWVPLAALALVVGLFEAVFFRGFVQTRLEAAYGPVAGIAGAAVLYGLYHVGYGMGGSELVFLTGLGVVYAVAFAQTRSVLVLWPLMTPLGSFFNAVDGGDIDLPWASIMGFADVLALMALALWLGLRHERRSRAVRTPVAPTLAHH
jgi:membrane protease YdiL (CAAX protease family)